MIVDGNNYGFKDPKNFPYRKKEDEFVIGIFGGSTALHFSEYLLESKIWENAISDKGKKIVIVNFALSGMKQPCALTRSSIQKATQYFLIQVRIPKYLKS